MKIRNFSKVYEFILPSKEPQGSLAQRHSLLIETRIRIAGEKKKKEKKKGKKEKN